MAKIISNGQELVFPSGGVADVTVDSTLTKSDDGTIGVTTPVKAILTREAFEALPEAERNTGMYVVYDEEDESSTPSTPSESSSAGEVYSEEETVIGTWIDGKPLYRKVFESTTPPNKNSTAIISQSALELLNVDKYVHLHGSMNYLENAANVCLVSGTSADNTSFNMWIDARGIVCNVSATQYYNQNVIIILEYTKTTDTATS